MKYLSTRFLALLALTVLAGCSQPQWVEKLKRVSMPISIQDDPQIDVYFKYNQIVDGYEVTGRWKPFSRQAETGAVLLHFRNVETGAEYDFFSPQYHSHDTDEISFAKDFKGHNDGDIHFFDYISPDTADGFKDRNGKSPLGYYTPFQFLDIDFDGNNELLISDWYQGQAGNNYEVYKMADNKLKRLDYIPLDRLTNVDQIDLKNKTITLLLFSGADDDAYFYFSKKERKDKITEVPNFYSNSAASFDFEKYNNEIGAPFVLDSIKEFTVKMAVATKVKYIVNGNKVIR